MLSTPILIICGPRSTVSFKSPYHTFSCMLQCTHTQTYLCRQAEKWWTNQSHEMEPSTNAAQLQPYLLVFLLFSRLTSLIVMYALACPTYIVRSMYCAGLVGCVSGHGSQQGRSSMHASIPKSSPTHTHLGRTHTQALIILLRQVASNDPGLTLHLALEISSLPPSRLSEMFIEVVLHSLSSQRSWCPLDTLRIPAPNPSHQPQRHIANLHVRQQGPP